MKKFLLSMAIMLIAAASAFAQVPTVMMYQVQVNHGKAAAQNVTIEMQLRTSQTGSAVCIIRKTKCSQFFERDVHFHKTKRISAQHLYILL